MDSPVVDFLAELHASIATDDSGEVATYIPALADADPRWFGICVVATDGRVYEIGDTGVPFTLQSISKAFTYGLALADRGEEVVLSRVGVEPTGDAFNSIRLAPGTGCPQNPMINAGAIATAGLICGETVGERERRLIAAFSAHAGRGLTVDERVYASERATGHRNRAIGHLLRNFDVITGDPEEAVDLYFRQCSIAATCRDLGVMAATLANDGVNPLTGERAMPRAVLDNVLSVMMSCGMYDYAGEWLYRVGIPAKSGVSGGLMAVLPGQLGVAVFSPRLDAHGNSVRGLRVCEALSRQLDLHCLRVPRSARAILRASYDVAAVRSKRQRRADERARLDVLGVRACVHELQGDLLFAGVERVVREVVAAAERVDIAVLDLRRVSAVDDASAQVLAGLVRNAHVAGKPILLAHMEGLPALASVIHEEWRAAGLPGSPRVYADLDHALEACEEHLLAKHEGERATVALADHDLCRGLSAEAIAALARQLVPRSHAAGEIVVRAGEPADEIYLLMRGEVSVVRELPGGRTRRLNTLSAGMIFGELAVIRRSPRSAEVRADTDVELLVLSQVAFASLDRTDPGLRISLLENLLRHVAQMVALLDREVATLTG